MEHLVFGSTIPEDVPALVTLTHMLLTEHDFSTLY
jgi:hypothetical protein